MKDRNTIFGTILLACFGLLLAAQAVSPPPDGGYSGGNTAEGQNALLSLNSGAYNTAVGLFSLESNTTGNFNTAIGAGALLVNTADENTATGVGALLTNSGGADNTATGAFALFSNTNTGGNTATGADALFSNTGGGNTAVGYRALFNNTTGLFNTALGNFAGIGVTTANNVICIGANGVNADNSCFIGNISGADATGGDAVFITSDGKLGTVNPPSAARYKEEIKSMDKASEAILALNPVTIRYKKEFDSGRIQQFGLVAEEVEKVNPDLVKRDRDGKVQTVRYDAVNAMLLNEFLKAHRKIVEQQRQIDSLTAEVKKQAVQLRKVSEEVQSNRSTRPVLAGKE
jgi:trimeric autotransporter adhesin